MIIGLFPNLTKRQSKSIAVGIREYLSHRGVTVVAEDDEAMALGARPLSEVSPSDIAFTIILGGDGTILRFLHRYEMLQAPLLGINLGSLGFMADIPITDIYPCLQSLLQGHFHIEERIMMEGLTINNNKCFALNEIVFHRAQNPCLIDLGIHVDGNYLNTFSADGVIVATPSGSTAYSLAAGGPILTPELKAFVLTPISPHTISNRPIVLMPKQSIQVQYISEYDPIEVTYDGIASFQMATGEMFHITTSEYSFKLVNMPQYDYFSTLRKKLGWTGKLRSS